MKRTRVGYCVLSYGIADDKYWSGDEGWQECIASALVFTTKDAASKFADTGNFNVHELFMGDAGPELGSEVL